MTVDCKKLAWRIFTKENGITLKVDALKCIEENLSKCAILSDEQSVCEALNFILSSFKTQNSTVSSSFTWCRTESNPKRRCGANYINSAQEC